MIRIVFIRLDAMLPTGQLRGQGAKVGFFSRAYEGGVFPPLSRHRMGHRQTVDLLTRRHVVSWTLIVSTPRAQADFVQCLRPTLEC
jgi:hypothetical protein